MPGSAPAAITIPVNVPPVVEKAKVVLAWSNNPAVFAVASQSTL